MELIKKQDTTLATSLPKELIELSTEHPKRLTSITAIAEVIETGVSLRYGKIHSSARINKFLLEEINRAIKIIGANKTIDTDEELNLCVQELLNENPQIKIEEVRTIFDNMITGKYGKYYERFKVAEVLEGFKSYQNKERCIALQKRNESKNDYAKREIKAFEDSLKNYEHKINYGDSSLKHKISLMDKYGNLITPTIENLRDRILTKEELEIIEGG